jgi:hypothetical protein
MRGVSKLLGDVGSRFLLRGCRRKKQCLRHGEGVSAINCWGCSDVMLIGNQFISYNGVGSLVYKIRSFIISGFERKHAFTDGLEFGC